MWFQRDVGDVLLPRATVNTEVSLSQSDHSLIINAPIQVILLQENQQWVSPKLSSPVVVFVLCNYFQWKQPLRSAWWINAGPGAERENVPCR